MSDDGKQGWVRSIREIDSEDLPDLDSIRDALAQASLPIRNFPEGSVDDVPRGTSPDLEDVLRSASPKEGAPVDPVSVDDFSFLPDPWWKKVGKGGDGGSHRNVRHLREMSYITILAKDPATDAWTLYQVMGFTYSSSHSSILSSSSSPGGPSSSSVSPSKFAVVKAGDRWLGWQCSEEPGGTFHDTMTVLMEGNEGYRRVDPKFYKSVEPGSLRVYSALPDVPCRVSSFVFSNPSQSDSPVIQVRSRGFRKPKVVTVRVQGRRRGSLPRWTRFQEWHKDLNDLFWGLAVP